MLFLPLFILWRIKQKVKTLTEPIQTYKYGFICSEYSIKYFYWEFIRIFLRLSIIILGNILSDEYLSVKIFLSIILLQIYNKFLNKLKPYKDKQSQSLDKQYNQMICLLFLLYQLQFSTKNIFLQNISAFFQFFIYIISLTIVVVNIFYQTVKSNQLLYECIIKKLPFLKKRLVKSSNSLRIFLLWKKIKQNFDRYRRFKQKQKQKLKNQQLDSQTMVYKFKAIKDNNNLNSNCFSNHNLKSLETPQYSQFRQPSLTKLQLQQNTQQSKQFEKMINHNSNQKFLLMNSSGIDSRPSIQQREENQIQNLKIQSFRSSRSIQIPSNGFQTPKKNRNEIQSIFKMFSDQQNQLQN
ncbi:transmembrane protein, putative (macronuclear) [Tetrahymena thermophila SB210]|uniref:Transmembrane protein, putative n=1 Tax=Tetrahymena thermophila (strain SB210) TaxID=312017 RepID=Q23AM9_TETTS|nr:transmembrane protein, putative [Tetrahymena thermophila SB210]EAR93463.2 transmembrane protein, putative [Tetrahymena thermophila SB210]|eukprot:XP_001013708.2 transmembrane protein, putative [Tetrahymena thermophila SB210]